METTISKTQIERNTKLIAIGAFFGCIGIICFILHLSPSAILEKLADFAAHHYFLAGFIFLIISLASLKFYYTKNQDEAVRISRGKSRALKRRILLASFKRKIGFARDSENSLYVKKEGIVSLKFNNEEVLASKQDQENRSEVLKKARVLGNLYKQKVIICFKDNVNTKHTLATVWHADEEHVSLKGGATIPVKRILKIEI